MTRLTSNQKKILNELALECEAPRLTEQEFTRIERNSNKILHSRSDFMNAVYSIFLIRDSALSYDYEPLEIMEEYAKEEGVKLSSTESTEKNEVRVPYFCGGIL